MNQKLQKTLSGLWEALHHWGFIMAIKQVIRFVLDLVIVLAVATLFMRFFIICGVNQTASLIIGMASAAATTFYIKFRNKLL